MISLVHLRFVEFVLESWQFKIAMAWHYDTVFLVVISSTAGRRLINRASRDPILLLFLVGFGVVWD